MGENFRNLVLRLMRVPPEPHAPAGSEQSVQVFRASKKYFQLKLLGWAFGQVSTLIGILLALVFLNVGGFGLDAVLEEVPRRDLIWQIIGVVEFLGILLFLVQLPFSYFIIRFDFEMRWYIVTDRSLRIREGVWKVREMTLTFANVQEVSIRQGPVQRLVGISDLQVRTAGGGAVSGPPAKQRHQENNNSHIGYFRGVDNAEEIRDLILERLKRLRDAGLGDPDQVPERPAASAAIGPTPELLDAARELLQVVRGLR
ncbi:MAG: PH domain-containing protein [Thermoanaerobaculales bacterium]|nr:PH domain-containing protein [Thermoanaerobaculales bacterium]